LCNKKIEVDSRSKLGNTPLRYRFQKRLCWRNSVKGSANRKWGLIAMRRSEGVQVYCCALSRNHTSEANEPQPDAAGNPDFGDGQPEYLRLDATRSRDPAVVGGAVEEAAREAGTEAKVAGGVPAVNKVVAHPAWARAATCAGVAGGQEQIRTQEAG
jgi:hypothetical protein